MKPFSKILFLTSFSFSLYGGSATWNLDTNGDWNVDGNWNPATGYPNGIDQFADFGNIITANRDVTITAPVTVGSISFDNANSYSILADIITMQVTSGIGTLTSTNGSHNIASDITLTSSILSSINSSGNFTISGAISGPGSLAKQGAGTLVYAGASANTYTGLTAVNAGDLQLNKTAGIDAIAGSLIIAPGGLVTLLTSDQMGSSSDVTIAGGILNMDANSDSINSLTMTSGTLTQTGASQLNLTSNATALTMGSATLTGNILLSGTGTFTFNGAATRANIAGTLDLGSSNHIFSIGNGADTIDTDISAAIVGSAGLTKQGAGSLSFSGSSNNTYTGTTTVNAGSLLLNKTGANAIAGPLVITSGTVQLLGANQIASTVDVTISGGQFDLNNFPTTLNSLTFSSGSLVQGANGTISLASTINALVMAGVTIPNDLTFTAAGGVIFNGVSGTAVIQGKLDLGSTFGHTFNIAKGLSSVDMDIQGAISNTGVITKTGAGVLQFSGSSNNTYTGITTVTAGTLVLNKTAGIDAIAGNLLINGGIVSSLAANQFNALTNTTLSSGGLNLQGFNAEMLSLAYNGGALTLSGGVLSLNSTATALTLGNQAINGQIDLIGTGLPTLVHSTAGSAQISSLNVTNPGTNLNLQLNGGGTLTLLSSSSQGGALVQSGPGTLILASGSHDFTGGASQINAGTLSVLGNLTTSTLNVAAGALLKGNGTITGNVTLHGTVEPGNSIGTLNIVGSYTFAGGSNYHVELNTTSADLINVTGAPGTIVIQPGAIITLQPQAGSFFSTETIYTLLNASGGLTGEFSQVTFANPIGINYSLVYGLNDLTLQVTSIPITNIIPPTAPGNIKTVGEVLDQLQPNAGEDLITVLTALYNLNSPDDLINALNQLQPSMLKGLTNIAAENTAIRNQDILEQRFHQIIYRDCSKKKPEKMLSIWTDLMGDYLHQNTKSLQPGFNLTSGSATLGVDYSYDGIFIGFASSYQYSTLNWKYSRGKGDINSLLGALYGGWYNHRFYADIAVQAGFNHFNETRHIEFSGINRYAQAHFNGGSLLSSFDLGMIFHAATIEFRPFISAEYLYLHQQAFHETGAGSINLKIHSTNAGMMRGETGFNFSQCFPLKKYNIRLDGSLSYIREQRFEGAKYKTAFIDTDLYFISRGMNPDRNLFSPGLSLVILSQDGRYASSFTYQAEVGAHYWNQNGQFQFGYRF